MNDTAAPDPAESQTWRHRETGHYVRVVKRTPKMVKVETRPSKRVGWEEQPRMVAVEAFVAAHEFIKGPRAA